MNITSAPWRYSYYYHGSIVNTIGQRICCNLQWQKEEKANASLIANAPTMLEALIDLVAQVEDLPNAQDAQPWLDKAKQAIEKATTPQP
jgi:hypothetical protein